MIMASHLLPLSMVMPAASGLGGLIPKAGSVSGIQYMADLTGFYVADEADRVVAVRNDSTSDMAWPYWTHDDLINAFVYKLRRLIVVKGTDGRCKVRHGTRMQGATVPAVHW